ncbi:MAG: glycine betaine ABC transporter substrate-binding protein [Polyangiales bacterium]
MTIGNGARATIAAMSIATLVTTTGACVSAQPGPAPFAGSFDGTVHIARNSWLGSSVDAELARTLLVDQLQLQADVVDVDETAQFPLLAGGTLDVTLEIWPSGHASDLATFVATGQVRSLGLLGPTGRIGWYVPTYMLDAYPELETWQGLRDKTRATLFMTPQTSPNGQFLAGDPTWTQYDAQIIQNLGLDFDVVYSGSEQGTIDTLDHAYGQHGALLFYFWVPHWALAKYDITAVALPESTPACLASAPDGGVACDYPPDRLFKGAWPGLRYASPVANALLSSIQLTTKDQVAIMGSVKIDGASVHDAVQTWLAANETTWKAWVATARSAQATGS